MAENKRNILVVDDDATVLEMIYEGLKDNDFNVIAINNPEEALTRIMDIKLSYALIDLDLGWKYITGIELGQQIKAKVNDLVVIIMTGYHNIKYAVDAMRKYSFHYMIKPFRIDQIISIIERADHEQILINENEALKIRVKDLEEENLKLNELLIEFENDIKNMLPGRPDKSGTRTVSDSNALRSYQRQK